MSKITIMDYTKLTDEEFYNLPNIPKETYCMKVRRGPTPSGGDYSTGIFFTINAEGEWIPCSPEEATHAEFSEYLMDGTRINGTYGTFG